MVKNIVFSENNYITSYNYVGSIASLNMGTIENCSNYADITATNFAAGGICGFMVNGNGTVKDCHNYGNVTAMTYASGICGGSQSGKSITTYSYLIEGAPTAAIFQPATALVRQALPALTLAPYETAPTAATWTTLMEQPRASSTQPAS